MWKQQITKYSIYSGDKMSKDFLFDKCKEGRIACEMIKPLKAKRCLLKWLEDLPGEAPSGIAVSVATRISKYIADIAVFWTDIKLNSHKLGPNKLLYPSKTMILEFRSTREQCWPDISHSSDLLPSLHELKKQFNAVKEDIKQDEPNLKSDDTLFEEYAEWDFEKTSNKKYHKLAKEIKEVEHSIYHGSFFEQIMNAEIADFLYLAVPAGLVHPYELADGWGLLWVYNDTTVREVHLPENRECLIDNKLHLVQNIARAAKSNVLFSYGITKKGEATEFVPIPKKRHSKKHTI